LLADRLDGFVIALPAVRPPAVFAVGLPAPLPLVFFVALLVALVAAAVRVAGALRATGLPAALADVLVVVLLLAVLLPAALRPAAVARVPAPDADFVVAVFFAAGLLAPVFLPADLRGLVVAMRVSRRVVAPPCSGTVFDNTLRMQDR
jgi:hypothetical protein